MNQELVGANSHFTVSRWRTHRTEFNLRPDEASDCVDLVLEYRVQSGGRSKLLGASSARKLWAQSKSSTT